MSRPIDHFVGRFDGRERGPLIVLIGGMHGNEPAGVIAIRRCFERLAGREGEPTLRGRLLGLLGHPHALAARRRFLDEDLNRVFTPARLTHSSGHRSPNVEEAAAKTLLAGIRAEIADYGATELIVLDVHTTSADGGDFVVLGDSPGSEALTEGLDVPVVLGLTEVLQGTLCGYLTEDTTGVPTRAFAYEAGAHEGTDSPDRAYALISTLLVRLGVTTADRMGAHVPLSLGVPRRPALTRVRFRLAIPPGGQFTMMPGFSNFDRVQAGQVVAVLDGESVALDRDGYLLMPLYQGQGSDGFFIVE